MEVILTKKDIESVMNYLENGGLVAHMNDFGLSYGSMALVLTELSNACNRILLEMMGKGEIDAD